MTDAFLGAVESGVRSGLSVSAIARIYGYDNRAVRRAKAHLYEIGALPLPVGYKPKERHANNNRD